MTLRNEIAERMRETARAHEATPCDGGVSQRLRKRIGPIPLSQPAHLPQGQAQGATARILAALSCHGHIPRAQYRSCTVCLKWRARLLFSEHRYRIKVLIGSGLLAAQRTGSQTGGCANRGQKCRSRRDDLNNRIPISGGSDRYRDPGRPAAIEQTPPISSSSADVAVTASCAPQAGSGRDRLLAYRGAGPQDFRSDRPIRSPSLPGFATRSSWRAR